MISAEVTAAAPEAPLLWVAEIGAVAAPRDIAFDAVLLSKHTSTYSAAGTLPTLGCVIANGALLVSRLK